MLWTARLAPEINIDGYGLYIYRHVSDTELEVVTELTQRGPITERLGVYETHRGGLRLPYGAGEAIKQQFTPVSSQGEIKRLEDSLELERARVDLILGKALR